MIKASLLVLFLSLAFAEAGQGKGSYNKINSSNVALTGSDTISEEMFQVAKDGDDGKKVSFGMFKIVELAADNTTINSTGHTCNFREMNITCTKGMSGAFVQDGLDDEGNSTDIRSLRITRTCDLSACNNGSNSKNATLILLTDIFDVSNGSYTCQPNCTTNANSTFQTPVSNGTVKWSFRMENWDFCDTEGSCGAKAGSQLKIVFKVLGKNKGEKEFKSAVKKAKNAYDSMKADKKCEVVRKSMNENRGDKARDMTKKENWKESSKQWTDKKETWIQKYKDMTNKDDGNDTESMNNNKGNNNKGPKTVKRAITTEEGVKTGDMNSTAGDKSGWGKCRNARGWGPGGKPDDQENYNFGSDNTSAVFRMMGMAVMDNDTVSDDTTKGFFGPGEHSENDKDGTAIPGLVYIIVPRFSSSMEYDPTVDIEQSGGAGEISYSASSSVVPFLSVISLLVAYLLA